MEFFESLLTLLLVAIGLLQAARRLSVPYPAVLALAGVLVAALPWAPSIGIDPHLALALFLAPTLLDAAFDLPPRTVRRDWVPLVSLAGVAVVLTTAAVAWLGVAWAHLPLAVAITLGAIVAPPDAAAATVMLGRLEIPRRTVTVLRGESLLNDASALLLYGAAVGVASPEITLRQLVPQLALAIPGGLLLGYVIARVYARVSRPLSATLGATLLEFVATFGVWLVAERLHVSPVLAVVAYAMTIARIMPEKQPARARVHSYAVWEAAVFLLNVLAFFLIGLQARAIVVRLGDDTWPALRFAAAVFGVVVLVRLAWVMAYNRLRRLGGGGEAPTVRQSLVVAWCGMRGLVTLAAALALPEAFPSRDLIVLSAFAVVLGTLVVQGLTLGPLIRFLKFDHDDSYERELADARVILLDRALRELGERDDAPARTLRHTYRLDREAAERREHPREVGEVDALRREILQQKRESLAQLRRSGNVEDDVFHALEQELDFAELASSPPHHVNLEES